MAECIEKLSHSCGSSDALQVFYDKREGYTGYCFSCGEATRSPYGESAEPAPPKKKEKDAETIRREIEEINLLPSLPLPDRGLTKEALEYFGVKIGVSEYDGTTPAFAYFPFTINNEVVGYSCRFLLDKKEWWIGYRKDMELFGWSQAIASGGKTLFVTEGCFDAVALYQALKQKSAGTKWEHLVPAVVSIKNGAGAAKAEISSAATKIRGSFNNVVLAFDQDDVGQKAMHQVMQVFPSATAAQLPEKDPNDCVKNGKSSALANAVLFRANTPKNTRIIQASTLYEAAREKPEWGLSWPWPTLTQSTRGMREGETYYFGAGVKMGKSELVNALASHLAVTHNMPIFMAKPEEPNKKSYKLMLGKIAGKVFHDPTVDFDYDAYDEAAKRLGDNLYLLDLYQNLDWSNLRADIIEASQQYGCKAVFIDPITNITNGVSSGDANTLLQGFAQELAAVVQEQGMIAFIFCHLKAPDSGPPHEEGGRVHSNQFAGSRAMMRSCNYMFGLEGNKDRNLPVEEVHKRDLITLEDREFGTNEVVSLKWDPETSLFSEVVDYG